jgi:hypothetical protein
MFSDIHRVQSGEYLVKIDAQYIELIYSTLTRVYTGKCHLLAEKGFRSEDIRSGHSCLPAQPPRASIARFFSAEVSSVLLGDSLTKVLLWCPWPDPSQVGIGEIWRLISDFHAVLQVCYSTCDLDK